MQSAKLTKMLGEIGNVYGGQLPNNYNNYMPTLVVEGEIRKIYKAFD